MSVTKFFFYFTFFRRRQTNYLARKPKPSEAGEVPGFFYITRHFNHHVLCAKIKNMSASRALFSTRSFLFKYTKKKKDAHIYYVIKKTFNFLIYSLVKGKIVYVRGYELLFCVTKVLGDLFSLKATAFFTFNFQRNKTV